MEHVAIIGGTLHQFIIHMVTALRNTKQVLAEYTADEHLCNTLHQHGRGHNNIKSQQHQSHDVPNNNRWQAQAPTSSNSINSSMDLL